ncbi:MAG: S49 family peptidase [Pseudomonadota bacterium]|nr:S49 family peptidase [Pseudomonadota bacterium]MDP1905485.1 S49 family peptidase [Pseudomonadota bacterium]MDP2353685.1 S49 family peptidase [Pseudomonadota bacterium]
MSSDDERGALERLLLAHLVEQRKTRRWGLFFKSLGFIWLFIVVILVFSHDDGGFTSVRAHTALIDINGEIGGGDGVSADDLIAALNAAFEDKHSRAVVLRINSPGGSPVQAGQVYDEIRRLRGKNPKIPLYVVVDDVCASGGYYIAAAADKIFVDKASLVGSIGVLMDGFGFTESMKKLGVERRLLTAGENKGFLDPFSPIEPRQEAHARAMLGEVHRQFVQMVRQGRGKRLKESPEMFTGLIWSGARSIELGLADALGSLDYVAREVVKAKDIVDYSPRESLTDRLARRIGTAMGEAARPWARSETRLR